MPCPPEIAAILLDILRDGLLACRAAGSVEQCSEQADHLHNIPGLLKNYSPDLLRFYWDVERPAVAAHCDAQAREFWEGHWQRLRPHVDAARRDR